MHDRATTLADSAPAPGPLSTAPPTPPCLTRRVLLLGTAAILGICAIAPYNDFTLGNTPLIGNYLPISVVLLLSFFIVAINAPLSRYRPHLAFTHGELAVLLAMLLAGCAIPTTGLMRYFLPSLVTPQALAAANPEFAELFRSLHLPDALFPTFASPDRSRWPNDPIVTGYLGRWTSDSPYPYLAFLTPLLTWGLFLALLATATLCLVRIAYAQWAINERLAFPLATIQSALIAPPTPGRWFNATLQNRTFWFGLALTFCLHIWNGLAVYTASKVPGIPLTFDLTGIFREPPFSYAEGSLYKSQIFITAVAVTYLLRLPVSFSLWAFFLAQQAARMSLGTVSGEPNIPGQADFSSGAFLGFTSMTLYVGRRYFWKSFRAALGFPVRQTASEPAVQVLAGRLLVISVVGLCAWLVFAGCSVAAAVTIVLTLLVLFFGLTRIVAETGLIQASMFMPLTRPFDLAAQLGWGRVPAESFFLGRQLHCIFYDQRECLPVYASNSLRASAPSSGSLDARLLRKLTTAMALSLVIAYFASAYFHLRNEYTHAVTLGQPSETPIDSWGARNNINWQLIPAFTQYTRASPAADEPARGAMATGTIAAIALYAARLYIPAWPLHPVGLVMLSSYSLTAFWSSFFLAWLVKALVVRFGGYELYNRTKPLAIGLIIGESLAAATWLLVAVALAQLNLPFQPIQVLPR